jgi:hypothetical protein
VAEAMVAMPSAAKPAIANAANKPTYLSSSSFAPNTIPSEILIRIGSATTPKRGNCKKFDISSWRRIISTEQFNGDGKLAA